MVPYNPDRQPGFSQWSGGTLSATVVLDQAGPNVSYTNLDAISGKVQVRCGKSVDVSNIVVKLEGESRSRLLPPANQTNGERPKPQLEYHKILYKTETVFPSREVMGSRASSKGAYTLPPGTHEYPFSFKLPFNNSCTADQGLPSLQLELGGFKPAPRHVKQTLPPTLSGFPGEAEIKYFIKATVNRHSLFKENPRPVTPFNFLPIEPPRRPSTGSEVFARQKHQFTASQEGEMKSKMKGIFSKKGSIPSSPMGQADAPFFCVDARLPEPAVLTCNQDIPLRLIVKKLNPCHDVIYLQSLQISLIGSTKIRAHQLFRTESSSWIIMSKSNMGVPVGTMSDAIDAENEITDKLWRRQPLPNTVAPTFETCNISRTYQLDVRVGLSYAATSGSNIKSQTIVLPLRLDTLVYSGIAPPDEVLRRMADTKTAAPPPVKPVPAGPTPLGSRLAAETTAAAAVDVQRTASYGANQIPPTPIDASMDQAFPPAQAGTSSAAAVHMQDVYEDAPPSYEDAIAQDAPSVPSETRPTYAPPAPASETEPDAGEAGRDEKRGWV